MQYPPPGFNDVPAYLASGLPFVTASSAPTTALKVTFPYVTKFITIRAAGALDVGYLTAIIIQWQMAATSRWMLE